MEIGYPESLMTLVVLADGTTIFYGTTMKAK
jgi:hypothetical protein